MQEQSERMRAENAVKDCCPICGHQFFEVKPVNVCPTGHPGLGQEFTPEELIGCWDDYAWCI